MCDYLTGFGISFIYSKNNKGPDIGTPQFMVRASENTLSNETKKALLKLCPLTATNMNL